ncbi:MAG TPA: 3-deoxy-8-phosphooctulonate synthase [Acidobacteriota bacterium]|nr:3-deoxy-8-phosphooctulonate synthase [Acidobacteriota bacterium]
MGAVTLANGVVFGDARLGLIAGPCVIESRDHCLRMAEVVADVSRRTQVPAVFKASYYKANRTSVASYRGPGLDEGLRILAEVRDAVGLPVLTDVHEPEQAVAAAECVDVLQIPAFLCRQTDLVLAAAATGRPVNLKKGQFLAPWDMSKVVEKAASTGNKALLVTERGTSFGYNNLVVDFKGLSFLARLGYPVVLDVTHSLQLPARQGESTGGEPEFVEPLAAAGVAAGVDVLFLEVHDNPPAALSDASTQLPLERLEPLLEKLVRIRAAAGHTSTTGP